MADVIRSRVNPRPSRSDRGQLLLLTALGLATLLVVLALILNSAIFTETLATHESAAIDTTDAIRFQHTAIVVTTAMVDVENNRGADSYEAMQVNVSRRLEAWSAMATKHAATDARSVSVSLVSTTNGTRLAQDDVRHMTNRSNYPDWTLATDVTDVRRFRMTVTVSSLVDATGNDENATVLSNQDVFAVSVDDGDDKQVFIYSDSGNLKVRVTNSSDPDGLTCQVGAAGGDVTIDLVNATIDGTDCSALDGVTTPGTPTDIAFRDGSNAEGSYVVILNRPALDSDVASAGSNTDPYGERLLYTATVELRYVSPDLRYTNIVDVNGGDVV